MTKYLPFVFDEEGFLTNQKCFIITSETPAFLTAFFNSSLFKYCFRDNFPKLGDKGRELSKIFFEDIPVLQVNEAQERQFKELVLNMQTNPSRTLSDKIDFLIFSLYGLSIEETKTIGHVEIQ